MAQPWRCVSATISLSLPYKTMHLHPLPPPPHTHTYGIPWFTCNPPLLYHTPIYLWPTPLSHKHSHVTLPSLIIQSRICDLALLCHRLTHLWPNLLCHTLIHRDPPHPHHTLTHLWPSPPSSRTHSLVILLSLIIHALTCDPTLLYHPLTHLWFSPHTLTYLTSPYHSQSYRWAAAADWIRRDSLLISICVTGSEDLKMEASVIKRPWTSFLHRSLISLILIVSYVSLLGTVSGRGSFVS